MNEGAVNVFEFSPSHCRGCQNGSVNVWTLPQGGAVVPMPKISSGPTGQDKSTSVKVSSERLFDLFLRLTSSDSAAIRPRKTFLQVGSEPPVITPPPSAPFLQQESAKCAFVLHGHITAVKTLSFCSSGLALVTGGIGGLLNIWSLQVRTVLLPQISPH